MSTLIDTSISWHEYTNLPFVIFYRFWSEKRSGRNFRFRQIRHYFGRNIQDSLIFHNFNFSVQSLYMYSVLKRCKNTKFYVDSIRYIRFAPHESYFMKIFRDKASLQTAIAKQRNAGKIGFVPTMGALHEGHLALVKQALLENEYLVVSIFVNPTQFNNSEDLKNYPRDLDTDLAALKKCSEDIFVFAPSVKEMYSENVSAEKYDFDGLDQQMEGTFRIGHFDGVGTIVSRLFDIVKPDRAYFGEKDFQQLQIIRKLVSIKNLDIEIVGCEIVRAASGLALSSRNQLLNEQQKNEATLIYKTLQEVKKKIKEEAIEEIYKFVSDSFKKHPLFRLDYFQIADEATLKPIKEFDKNKSYRAFLAVYADEVRLIDNIALN